MQYKQLQLICKSGHIKCMYLCLCIVHVDRAQNILYIHVCNVTLVLNKTNIILNKNVEKMNSKIR